MERFQKSLTSLKKTALLWQAFAFVFLVACNGGAGQSGDGDTTMRISSVSPAEGIETGGTTITIRGANLRYAQTVTIDGTSCGQATLGNDDITCVTPPHVSGAVEVAVSSYNEGTATGSFTYIPDVLSVSSFSPSSALVAGGTLLTLTGTGFSSDVTVTINGSACTGVTALSSTSLRCTTPALAAGSYPLVVADSNDSVTTSRTIAISAPPTFTSISPVIGSAAGGTTVTITGTNFSRPTVSIGSILCTVTAKTSTSITCTTGAHAAGLVAVRVQNSDGNGVTTTGAFTYILNPNPTSVSPTHVLPVGGDTLTINGTGFKNGATVDIEGSACAPVTFVSNTRLTCTTPAKAVGFYDVTVTNPDTISATLANGYESRELPPVLTSVSPTSGFQVGGQTLTLTGTGFLAGATVTVGGSACTGVTVVNATTVTCTTPSSTSAGAKDVKITNTDTQNSTLSSGITYYPAPDVTSVSPSGGALAGGTLVTIYATGLQAAPTVTVGGNPCVGVTLDTATPPTFLTCTVAAHAAGATDIVVTNTDTQTDTGTGLYTYAVAPTVTSVTPNAGRAGGGALITITGSDFVSGATVSLDGSACNMVTFVDSTTITCRTPAHVVAPAVDLVVTNPDTQTGTLVAAYTYQNPPTVASVSPNGGSTGGGTSITITGTNFVNGATVLLGTDNCPVTATTATTITCTTPAHVAGVVNVKVTNPDTQSSTLTNGFTFVEAPVVTSVSRNAGALAGGTTVTITGNYFLAGATVDFGGSACGGVTFVSATTLTCTTTAHAAGAVTVTVIVDSQSGALANGYTYEAAPTVTSVSPVAGALAGGTTLTITGTDFISGAAVDLGGSACTVSATTATSITCTTTAHVAGAVGVKVTNPDTQTNTLAGAYTYQAAPTVTAVSPAAISSAGATVMTITGTDFDGAPTVTFGGTACPVTASTATSITCTSPAHAAGVVDIIVTNSDTQTGTLASTLIYLDAPTVSAVSPSAGALAGGTTLTITGTNFYTGATVDVGGAACTIVSLSATSISCTTTAKAAGTYAVTVTNVDAQAGNLAASYTYQPAPTVTSVAFNAGAVGGGTTVTVNGTDFVAGATVLFDTSACVVTAESATAITCITPAHAAGTVNVTVTNTDTQTNTLSNGYTYEVAPTVSTISPAVGPIAGGTSVTITGTGFLAAPSVSIGSVNCAVTASTSTSITCTTGARASGVVDVQVTNADSQSGTKTNAFTYLDAPTVASISPVAGAITGGQTVTITGTNFYANAAISIGGSSCTLLTVSSGSITCRTTAHAAANVGVTVTNVDAQSATLAAAYDYRPAPTVTSVSPTYGAIGGGTALTITGTGFVTGVSVTVGSSSCTVNAVTLTSTNIDCTTTLSLISGSVAVTATNPDDLQSGSKSAAFIYLNPPTVTSVSPNAGALAGGSTVAITGTGFYPGVTVSIGGVNCTPVTYTSDTAISCTTGAHAAGAVDVVVTNPDAQTGTKVGGFTYQVAPTLTSITPASGQLAGGTSVTITGTDFVSGATVKIGGSNCTSVVVASSTSITCNTPPGLSGAASVQVTNADGQSDTIAGLYTYQAAPTVTSVSPTGGPLAGGASITITGTNFLAGATVSIGGTACGGVVVGSSTSITCTTAAKAAGSYTVTVTNTDNQVGSKTNGYTYQGAPTISAISPAVGASAGGTTVTVTGTNFLASATVSIGGTNCGSVSVTSATTLTCVTGVHAAGTGTITVTNTDSQSGTGSSYLYQDAPTVTSVSPATSPTTGGQAITVTGTGFLTGAVVKIGTTSCASVTVVDSTTITCTTAAKAGGTYDLTVTNTDTQVGTLTNGFAYQGAPTVTTVSPSLGDVGGGQVITITGTNFLAGALVTIGGTSCAVSSVAATSITCTTGAKLAGTYSVVVTNTDSQAGTKATAYTYADAPTVTAVSPATGDIAGGTTVTITGTNFFSGSTVDFGGSACTSVSVTSTTSLTCVTPAHAVGAVAVSVVSPVSTTGTLAAAFTYTSTPATLAFQTGTSSPNPPNPDSYGSTTTNVTHTYTLKNTGASDTTNVTVTITGANAASFAKGTDNCSGAPLTAGSSCTIQVTFLGAFQSSGAYTATLTATAATGGTVTNTMNGNRP